MLNSPDSSLVTAKFCWGHCRQPFPLGLEWLVRLAIAVLVRQLLIKVHVGWKGVLFSAWSVCCTATQKAGQQKVQQSGFERRKGSDVDVWLHLFSLHAAVVMFIREYEPAQQMLLSWREG